MNLIEQIKSAGIVGAGGAGFPTYFKLESAKGKVDTYIINCAECEPLLKVDQQILKIYTDKILSAAVTVGEYLGVKKVVIAIKEKYHETIDELKKVLPKYKNVDLYLLRNFYPAGDEFSLVYEVTGRITPEAGLPLNVGCVVNNVVTLLNIWNAINTNFPVITRPVTVVGEVKQPKTLIVPVGTLITDLLTFCAGPTIENFVIIDGGPMMGKIVSLDDVVTKKTSGIIVLPVDHPVVINKMSKEHHFLYQTKSACEQCQDCTEICPRYLLGHRIESHKIQRFVSYKIENETLTQAYLCCECGLCDWVCPVALLPRRVNQQVKQQLIKKGIKNTYNLKPEKVRNTKEYRLVPLERILFRFSLDKYLHPAPIELDTKEVQTVNIPLVQHIGTVPTPIVKVGDKVVKGQLLATVSEGKLGVGIHSPIDGKITKINGYIKIET